MLSYVWLIPALPLLGVLVNATAGRWFGRRLVAAIASLAVGASFALASLVFVTMLGVPATALDGGNGREWTIPIFRWIVTGDLKVEARLLLDQVSILMTLVVTSVSTLVHIYSAAYMRGDEHYKRYFTWLNLFVFMMLVLVLGDSFLTMYIGWEGVGVCSYLLIGYWFERESAAEAAKKAFLVNRVGDFGFLLAILLIFSKVGSLAFQDVFPAASALAPAAATVISLLLFLGASAKSAQIPLYIWLPHAMEGPTPVSALIHAATMVTAGVYMVVRCYSLFERSGSALQWVAWIGVLTALFGATMAIVETDLKRILAYSTISQLGYMFLGAGVGTYTMGLFQLTTHAFYKALFFLCAGSVMHALGGETDIFKMGGLRKRLPWTWAACLVAVLSISGVPLFAGFFSKDEIMHLAFVEGNIALGVLALVTAGLSGFYGFRLFFVTFYGSPRVVERSRRSRQMRASSSERGAPSMVERAQGIHESPWLMLAPMLILAVLSVTSGYLGLPKVLGLGNAIDQFLHPAFSASTRSSLGEGASWTQWAVIGASLVETSIAITLAWWLYIRKWGTAERWSQSAGWLYNLISNKYYVDQAYERGVVQPLRALAAGLSSAVEARGIDGAVTGVGRFVSLAGEGLHRLNTGRTRQYALVLLAGAALIVSYL
ncbi:MAG TPA: NADH-quinone oxidoreductase subunit L, partial [Anaerolineae bacterium]|nr:NADH-quinone oxidoreductase subunit L [Anaerolineae bacterium]